MGPITKSPLSCAVIGSRFKQGGCVFWKKIQTERGERERERQSPGVQPKPDWVAELITHKSKS